MSGRVFSIELDNFSIYARLVVASTVVACGARRRRNARGRPAHRCADRRSLLSMRRSISLHGCGVVAVIAVDVYYCAASRGRSFCWRRCPPARQVVPSRAWRARRTGASSAWLSNSTTGRAAFNERAVARPGARSRVRCLELNLLSGLGHPHKCSSPGSDRLEVRQLTNAAKYGRMQHFLSSLCVFVAVKTRAQGPASSSAQRNSSGESVVVRRAVRSNQTQEILSTLPTTPSPSAGRRSELHFAEPSFLASAPSTAHAPL